MEDFYNKNTEEIRITDENLANMVERLTNEKNEDFYNTSKTIPGYTFLDSCETNNHSKDYCVVLSVVPAKNHDYSIVITKYCKETGTVKQAYRKTLSAAIHIYFAFTAEIEAEMQLIDFYNKNCEAFIDEIGFIRENEVILINGRTTPPSLIDKVWELFDMVFNYRIKEPAAEFFDSKIPSLYQMKKHLCVPTLTFRLEKQVPDKPNLFESQCYIMLESKHNSCMEVWIPVSEINGLIPRFLEKYKANMNTECECEHEYCHNKNTQSCEEEIVLNQTLPYTSERTQEKISKDMPEKEETSKENVSTQTPKNNCDGKRMCEDNRFPLCCLTCEETLQCKKLKEACKEKEDDASPIIVRELRPEIAYVGIKNFPNLLL